MFSCHSYILSATDVMHYYVLLCVLTDSKRVIVNVEEALCFLCSFDGHFLKESLSWSTPSPLQLKRAVWIALFLLIGQVLDICFGNLGSRKGHNYVTNNVYHANYNYHTRGLVKGSIIQRPNTVSWDSAGISRVMVSPSKVNTGLCLSFLQSEYSRPTCCNIGE